MSAVLPWAVCRSCRYPRSPRPGTSANCKPTAYSSSGRYPLPSPPYSPGCECRVNGKPWGHWHFGEGCLQLATRRRGLAELCAVPGNAAVQPKHLRRSAPRCRMVAARPGDLGLPTRLALSCSVSGYLAWMKSATPTGPGSRAISPGGWVASEPSPGCIASASPRFPLASAPRLAFSTHTPSLAFTLVGALVLLLPETAAGQLQPDS